MKHKKFKNRILFALTIVLRLGPYLYLPPSFFVFFSQENFPRVRSRLSGDLHQSFCEANLFTLVTEIQYKSISLPLLLKFFIKLIKNVTS